MVVLFIFFLCSCLRVILELSQCHLRYCWQHLNYCWEICFCLWVWRDSIIVRHVFEFAWIFILSHGIRRFSCPILMCQVSGLLAALQRQLIFLCFTEYLCERLGSIHALRFYIIRKNYSAAVGRFLEEYLSID